MSLLREQCVVDHRGRIGIIIRCISSEVVEVLFGMRYGDHTLEILLAENLRGATFEQVLDWRAEQGFDGPDLQEWRKANGYAYSRFFERSVTT